MLPWFRISQYIAHTCFVKYSLLLLLILSVIALIICLYKLLKLTTIIIAIVYSNNLLFIEYSWVGLKQTILHYKQAETNEIYLQAIFFSWLKRIICYIERLIKSVAISALRGTTRQRSGQYRKQIAINNKKLL